MFERALRSAVAGLVLAAGLAAAQSPTPAPADVQAWLKAVDDARNAFGEAKIAARATQLENGNGHGFGGLRRLRQGP